MGVSFCHDSDLLANDCLYLLPTSVHVGLPPAKAPLLARMASFPRAEVEELIHEIQQKIEHWNLVGHAEECAALGVAGCCARLLSTHSAPWNFKTSRNETNS